MSHESTSCGIGYQKYPNLTLSTDILAFHISVLCCSFSSCFVPAVTMYIQPWKKTSNFVYFNVICSLCAASDDQDRADQSIPSVVFTRRRTCCRCGNYAACFLRHQLSCPAGLVRKGRKWPPRQLGHIINDWNMLGQEYGWNGKLSIPEQSEVRLIITTVSFGTIHCYLELFRTCDLLCTKANRWQKFLFDSFCTSTQLEGVEFRWANCAEWKKALLGTVPASADLSYIELFIHQALRSSSSTEKERISPFHAAALYIGHVYRRRGQRNEHVSHCA